MKAGLKEYSSQPPPCSTQASLEVNYSYTGGRREEPTTTVNANLTYDRATGANVPFTNIAARPFPTWGTVNLELLDGWSNYHGTDFTFTKIDGMIETYNLFNHANYGSYTTNMANAQFGQPAANAALAYQPRMLQLGVKFTF